MTITAHLNPSRALLLALQLASPALPVGGFAYSQGLERAIEDGAVVDEASAQRWIKDALTLVLARYEAPMWLKVHRAGTEGDRDRMVALDEALRAQRETAEMRAESLQMGASLLRVLPALGGADDAWTGPIGYPAAFALACARLGLDATMGLTAYLWSWCENQVLVAVKTVPLGQMAGQRMLWGLHGAVERAVEIALEIPDDAIGSAGVALAITSARHEFQYSRLFRS